MRLCDDLPDRDFERFDTAALPKLAELFLGKTGISDHRWSAEGQLARIFDTEVLPDGAAHFIRAQCYMLRMERTKELIAEIEGGIKKEVSVGCAMKKSVCSVCGSEEACEHLPGEHYDGQLCVRILCEPTDAYEFSFVAVPAQKEAGVLKARRSAAKSLAELVSEQGSTALKSELARMEREADFGRHRREAEIERVVSCGLLLGFSSGEEILRKVALALDAAELSALREAMEKKLTGIFPPQTQLPRAKEHTEDVDTAFLI